MSVRYAAAMAGLLMSVVLFACWCNALDLLLGIHGQSDPSSVVGNSALLRLRVSGGFYVEALLLWGNGKIFIAWLCGMQSLKAEPCVFMCVSIFVDVVQTHTSS